MACLAVQGCAPEPGQPGPESLEETATQPEIGGAPFELMRPDDPATAEPPRKMDWSLPPDFDFGSTAGDEPPDDSTLFDAEELFKSKSEPSRISGSLIPIIKESDDPDEELVIDGGKVTIEIKTE